MTAYIFYFSIIAGWLFTLFLFFRELAALRLKPLLLACLCLAAAFSLNSMAAASPRGGYDNEQDFTRTSMDFRKLSQAGLAVSTKEASPLFTDAIADTLGGSLFSLLVKNRVLEVLSGIAVFLLLLAVYAGPATAGFGTALFMFSFLFALNGNTFSTTPANIFVWAVSLLALVSFFRAPSGAGFAFVSASLFVLLLARYELFLADIIYAGALFFSLSRENRKKAGMLPGLSPSFLAGSFFLAVAAAWVLRLPLITHYNGPDLAALLRLSAAWRNFVYQLGTLNLEIPLGRAGTAAVFAAVPFLALALWDAAADNKRGPLIFPWTLATAVCLLYFSVIFVPLDEYPLQFMRHQLYFFLPAVLLAAAAWDAVWRRARRPGALRKLEYAALALLIPAYAWPNYRAVLNTNGLLRTNDMEWDVLLEASRNWPEGCVLRYPLEDSRRGIFKKYFPLSGDAAADCSLKYFSPFYSVFPVPGEMSGGYEDKEDNTLLHTDRPWKRKTFAHRFYTNRKTEVKAPVTVEAGFYYSGNTPAERALLSRDSGAAALRKGNCPEALVLFKASLAADPSCCYCRYYLAAGLAVCGGPGEAAGQLGTLRESCGGRLGELYLKALAEAAAGKDKAAYAAFAEIFRRGKGRTRAAFDFQEALLKTRGCN